MAMTPKEIIAVVQHFDAGGKVQVKSINPHITKWEDTDHPLWDFVNQVYRRKPKPLEWWCNVNESGKADGYTYISLEHARQYRATDERTVHMREVLGD